MNVWKGRLMAVAGLVTAILLTVLFNAAMGFHEAVLAADAGVLAAGPALKKLLGEIKKVQDEYKGKRMPEDVATSVEAKVTEAQALQAELDREAKITGALAELEAKAGRIPDPILPNDDQPDETKNGNRILQIKNRPNAYVRLGDFVIMSKGLQDFKAAGKPKAPFRLAEVPSMFGRKGESTILVGLNDQQINEFKAVPTFGDAVIEPQRVADVVRVTENDRLQLRDVLDVQRTNSDAVKYTRIVSYTRGAATVANSALKPEATLDLDSVTEAVRTVAVHMPVEEQQLDDYPQLSGIINGELLYDVNKHLEELVIYGDGVGENFNGILNDPGVLDARSQGGDTLIDIARRGITDVRRAGYEPNAILVDPLDWEEIVLAKGTDNRYVWVVVTDGATQRLWAVPVIETVAMEDFQGDATERRHLLVGDFQRGATLWDRMDASISVGWVNDQFIRNQRTILAELRAAFGVKRPGAFRKHETQEAVSS